MRTTAALLLAALALGACKKDKQEKPRVQLAAVERRDIVVDAEATGTVEPINIVEIKSKASGLITKMPVETGTNVKPGDLLVQVDTRDVQNQYNQALADVRAAEAKIEVSRAQKKRSDDMFGARIITAQEHETAVLDLANSQAALVRAQTNLDLAKQRLEDATVTAPVSGTVIEKTVSLGTVISSATGSIGGGTTLLKMADLNVVRVRAFFNETDIGSVQPGQNATVTTDAYPDRPFHGLVEKIEPQAVVQQSVTMFPVLITLQNREGLLKPGMNGEVSLLIDRRDNVLSVPNDAVRNPREAVVLATTLGLDSATVAKEMQAQFAGMRGGNGGNGGNGAVRSQSQGEVALDPQQSQQPQQGAQQGGGRPQLPEVTPAQCDSVTAAFAKKPELRQKLQTLREQMQSGQLDFQAGRQQSQAVYQQLGINPMVARACQMRQREQSGGGAPSGAPNGASPNGASPNGAARGAQRGGQSGAQAGRGPEVRVDGEMPQGGRGRTRMGLVFVADSGTFHPRIVRLGVANFDYTEVVSGAREGEQVAMLSAASMQAQRQQNLDRFRSMTGGGVPGMGGTPPAGGGRPGGAPAGGGGRRP